MPVTMLNFNMFIMVWKTSDWAYDFIPESLLLRFVAKITICSLVAINCFCEIRQESTPVFVLRRNGSATLLIMAS